MIQINYYLIHISNLYKYDIILKYLHIIVLKPHNANLYYFISIIKIH